MNRRLALATLLFAFLAVSAGCASPLGSGGSVGERVSQPAQYGDQWYSPVNVSIDVGPDEYTAVYRVDNQSTLEVYRYDSFGDKAPLPISAVQFQYPNQTVVNLTQSDIEDLRHKTVITLPARAGKVAFTAPAGGKTFSTSTFVDGSYEVILPPGMRVGVFLLSDVRPRGYETTVVDGRTHLTWDDVTTENVVVRFYLERDLTIFGGIIAALSIVALIGLAYFYRKIQQLEAKRKEMGLDVDVSDDDFGGGGPPPFR